MRHFGKQPRGRTYRGISYSGHQPSVAAYIDAQQGWLYFYTNFNSVKFSTSPAVEVTVAVGARPTVGPFEFDIGAAYYYYPGEIGPDLCIRAGLTGRVHRRNMAPPTHRRCDGHHIFGTLQRVSGLIPR